VLVGYTAGGASVIGNRGHGAPIRPNLYASHQTPVSLRPGSLSGGRYCQVDGRTVQRLGACLNPNSTPG